MMNELEASIGTRLYLLVEQGQQLITHSKESAISDDLRPDAIAWLLSTIHMLEVALPPDNRHRCEAMRLLPSIDSTIFVEKLANVLGVLKSAAFEWTAGTFRSLEFHFVGLVFEDFLRHAAVHNENGQKKVAAVLASAVLEDTVNRLCQRANIDTTDKKLDALISALKTRQVLTKVKAERLRSYATIRNQAFHADWDVIDIKDLRHMIEGLEEIIEIHFK